ncbi:MAG: DUF4097 family beta strand repeat-containing protein [Myxococcota bacterium]
MIGRVAGRMALAIAILGSQAPSAIAKDYEDRIAARPGGRLQVDLASGSVEVESHDENEVRVDAQVGGVGARSLDFRLSGNGVDVFFSADVGGWAQLLGGTRLRVRLKVPEHYDLDIRTHGGNIEVEEIRGDVVARTSGGSVEVDEIEGNVDLRSSGGSIEAKEIRGNLVARTSGGRIRASEISGDVEARTSGGPIKITDVGGRVDLHTSGGGISVRFTDDPEGQLETSGGNIEVEFPEDAGVDLDARTSGGGVEVEHEIVVQGRLDRSRVEGKINGGGRTLQLRTSGGSIRVRAR